MNTLKLGIKKNLTGWKLTEALADIFENEEPDVTLDEKGYCQNVKKTFEITDKDREEFFNVFFKGKKTATVNACLTKLTREDLCLYGDGSKKRLGFSDSVDLNRLVDLVRRQKHEREAQEKYSEIKRRVYLLLTKEEREALKLAAESSHTNLFLRDGCQSLYVVNCLKKDGFLKGG